MVSLQQRGPSLAKLGSFLTYASAIAIVVLCRWFTLPSGDPIEEDAYENLSIAYNLAFHDVISLGEMKKGLPDLRPTNYREPLPPFILSLYLKALQRFQGPLTLDFLEKGSGARLAKLSNIFWGIVLCLSVFLAVTRHAHRGRKCRC